MLNPELGGDALTQQVDFYKENITSHGGEIISVESWGKLTLAYPIERHTEGVYTVIQFNAGADYLPELEKRYKFNEDVLRHVIVQIDEKKFKLKPRKEPARRPRHTRRDDEQAAASDVEESAVAVEAEAIAVEAEAVTEE